MESTDDAMEIGDLISSLERAINEGDAADAAACYAADGVFMPAGGPTAIGTTAIRGLYEGIFIRSTLALEFDVAEVRLVSDTVAFACTAGRGTETDRGTGAAGPVSTREVILLIRENGRWRISHLIFNQLRAQLA